MPERRPFRPSELSPKELAKLKQQLKTKRFSADELGRLASQHGFKEVSGHKHRRYELIDDPTVSFQLPFRPGKEKVVSTGVQKSALRTIFPDFFKED